LEGKIINENLLGRILLLGALVPFSLKVIIEKNLLADFGSREGLLLGKVLISELL
jgi:hypothetical protein